MSVGDDDPAPNESLLDPRLHGWKVKKKWPGLFTLWAKGKQVRADLAPRLAGIESRLHHGFHDNSGYMMWVVDALLWLAVLEGIESDASAKLQPGTFEGISKDIVRDLLNAGMGKYALEIRKGKTKRLAAMAASNLTNLVKSSAQGLVRSNFPSKRGDVFPKERLAIWNARGLCEYFQRLPTKREVRERLEAIGVTYEKSTDPNGRWRELFARAGLSSLPD
jgi:hypothetical protein